MSQRDDRLLDQVRESLSVAIAERGGHGPGLRSHLLSRLFFPGFRIIEEIGTFDGETVPLLIGVKGSDRGSSRALLMTSTIRSELVPAPDQRCQASLVEGASPAIRGDHLVSDGVHCGLVDVACKLAAVETLRASDVNRPLVYLISLGESNRGSGVQTLRQRFGLEVSAALIGHPSAGALVSCAPGVAAVDVSVRAVRPIWRAPSLDPSVEARAMRARRGAAEWPLERLLDGLARAVSAGAAVFDPRAHGVALSRPWDARATVCGAGVGRLVEADDLLIQGLEPARLGFPLTTEIQVAARLARAARELDARVGLAGVEAEGETLRLSLRLDCGAEDPMTACAPLVARLRAVAAEQAERAGLEVQVRPRVFRMPYEGPRPRGSELYAAKAVEDTRAPSSYPSEAPLAGTEDALVYGPEDADVMFDVAERELPLARIRAMSETTARLLARLLS
jgi:hypothetical protein